MYCMYTTPSLLCIVHTSTSFTSGNRKYLSTRPFLNNWLIWSRFELVSLHAERYHNLPQFFNFFKNTVFLCTAMCLKINIWLFTGHIFWHLATIISRQSHFTLLIQISVSAKGSRFSWKSWLRCLSNKQTKNQRLFLSVYSKSI